MKIIKVNVEKFQANDGKIFDYEEDCIHHELVLKGFRKSCPLCEGKKKVDPYGDGKSFSYCNNCSGKGWVELKEVWS